MFKNVRVLDKTNFIRIGGKVFNFKRRKNEFDVQIFAILFSKHAYLTMGKIKKFKEWQRKTKGRNINS